MLDRELGGENGFDQEIIESATSLEPLDLRGAGRSDDEHLVLAEIESLFKKERNVRNEKFRAPCSSSGQRIKAFLSDAGMEDGLQTKPCIWIGKHPAAEKMAVYAAVSIQRLIAEGIRNDGGHLWIRFQHPMDRRIAIEDDERGQALGEQAADGGFTGRNPTGKRHDLHGAENPQIGVRTQAKKTGGGETLRPSDDQILVSQVMVAANQVAEAPRPRHQICHPQERGRNPLHRHRGAGDRWRR